MNNISYAPSFTSKVIIDQSCYKTGSKRINKFLHSEEFIKGIEHLRNNGLKGTVRIVHRQPNLHPSRSGNSLCMVFKSFTRKEMAVRLAKSSEGIQLQYSLMRKIFLSKKSLLKYPFRIFANIRDFFIM